MTQFGKCNTCRQRKIKCDERKPVCGPCDIKARPCSYEQRANNKAARNRNDELRLTTRRKAAEGAGVFHTFTISRRDGSTIQSLPKNEPASQPDTCPQCQGTRASHPKHTISNIGRLSFELLTGQACQQQIMGQYKEIWLPRRRFEWPALNTDMSVKGNASWLGTICDVAYSDPLLTDAILGWCLIVLANFGIDQEGYLRRLFYQRAYQRLRLRIQKRNGHLTDAVLATTRLLGFVEGNEELGDQSVTGCIAHVKGAAALVRARGDLNFSTPLAQELFLDQIRAQISVFFYDTEVQETFDPIQPPADRLRELGLIGMLWEFPNLIVNAKSTCRVQDAIKAVHMFTRLTELEDECFEWFSSVSTSTLYWTEPSQAYLENLDKGFPLYLSERLCFRDAGISRDLALYWTAMLELSATKQRLLQFTQKQLTSTRVKLPNINKNGISHIALSDRSKELTETLLQSLEYFVHPDMGMGGNDSPDVSAYAMFLKSFVVGRLMEDKIRWIELMEEYDSKATGRPRGSWLFEVRRDDDDHAISEAP